MNRYLCEKYDKNNKLIPKEIEARIKVLQWVHAAEATFALHGLATLYTRWTAPDHCKTNGDLEVMEHKQAVNIQNDLNWLETELSLTQGKFLCGDRVTAADTMMQFSIEFILARKLGTQGKEWPNIDKWLKACRETKTYKTAVKKTGHEL